jgi:hypothetical protein
MGWGGPAKGAHPAIENNPWTSETAPRIKKMTEELGSEEMAFRKARNVAKKDRIDRLEDELYDIAMDPHHPAPIRVMAIDKALDRLKGKPITPIVEPVDKGNITVKIIGGLPDDKGPEIDHWLAESRAIECQNSN